VMFPRRLGRRAPARGMPLLWGRSSPAFARWMVASPAARKRVSARSQVVWAREGRKVCTSRCAARNAEYRSRCTGPMPQGHTCQRSESGFLTEAPQPWQYCDSLVRWVGTRALRCRPYEAQVASEEC
jgi:hypothetical protein